MSLQGRRRPDRPFDDLPDDIQAGDYWKSADADKYVQTGPQNLTGTVWYLAAPMPSGGFAIGHLTLHTVREEEDGTISVRPGDGSSNSILMTGAHGQQYHGYIEHGVWS